MGHDKIRCLTLLDPFLTGNGLIVTPYVDLFLVRREALLAFTDNQRRPPRH